MIPRYVESLLRKTKNIAKLRLCFENNHKNEDLTVSNRMGIRIILGFFIAFFILGFQCYAADVLFLDIPMGPSVIQKQLEFACRFYGLEIESLAVGGIEKCLQVMKAMKQSGTRAVVIDARALSGIDSQKMLAALFKKDNKISQVLIAGISPSTDSSILVSWSGGAVIACQNFAQTPSPGFYWIADLKEIARELSNQSIPFSDTTGFHLILDNKKQSQSIMGIRSGASSDLLPRFVKTSVMGGEVFFETTTRHPDPFKDLAWQFEKKQFFEIAGLMMFLRYSLGDQCWHSVHNYANLTIDDPWLTEPYGFLSFRGLLEEMQKFNFHTTIAFIPWNFDRSKPEVVSIIRENPKWFSICVHGNNHDHREFYSYESRSGGTWSGKTMDLQEMNIRQAIARMERLRDLTGLSYDRVMVFPHDIAPAKTLGLLKKYNFISTVNKSNVPLGERNPKEVLSYIRNVTLEFESFPCFKRYFPNQKSPSDLAIDLFLDNPIILWGHHDLFKDGNAGFNKTAWIVNSIQPNTIWQSLGYISQHMYLQKLIGKGGYEILAFSSNFFIENVHKRDINFYVRKQESFSIPIRDVRVNGQSHPYYRSGKDLVLEIRIPAGESRHVLVEYENELDLRSIDISKNDLRVYVLRKLSDFRDMIMFKTSIGRTLIVFYYNNKLNNLGLSWLGIFFLVLVVFVTSGGLYLRRWVKKRKV